MSKFKPILNEPNKRLQKKMLSSNSQKNFLKRKAIWLFTIAVIISLSGQVLLWILELPINDSIYGVIVMLIAFIPASRALYLFGLFCKKDKPFLSKQLIFFSFAIWFPMIILLFFYASR